MKKNKFVVGVLAFNNIETIEMCLDSIDKEGCNAIVLDQYSTDGTSEIAKGFHNVKLCEFSESVFNISNSRNRILKIAQESGAQYVLYIDSDEIMPRYSEIESLVNRYPDVGCFMLCHKTYIYGRIANSAGTNNYHPRLIKVGAGEFKGINLERFHSDSGFFYSDIKIPHYTNSKGIKNWLSKNSRVAEDYANQLVQNASGGEVSTKARIATFLRAHCGISVVLIRFLYHYVVCWGFLEGRAGFSVSMNYAIFEYIVQQYLYEHNRVTKGLPL